MNIFSENLRLLRKKERLVQAQLADKLDVSVSNVSNWEKGVNFPKIELLLKISDLFSVSVDELLRGGDEIIQVSNKTTLVENTGLHTGKNTGINTGNTPLYHVEEEEGVYNTSSIKELNYKGEITALRELVSTQKQFIEHLQGEIQRNKQNK